MSRLLYLLFCLKLVPAYMLILLSGAVAIAQNSSTAAKPTSLATMDGIVTKGPGNPVKKALIVLIPENPDEDNIGYRADTGSEGAFHIEGIAPGRYRVFAGGTEWRVLTLTGGQELKDVEIRLPAAAVVRGRVTDEHGEPMPNARVAVLRQTFATHSRWEQAASERTNNVGEYRIANLSAGNYYVSVSPPKSLIEAVSARAAEERNAGTTDKPATSYQTTYYPGTVDPSQAAPIQLHASDDFPVNFSLTRSPSLSIRGSVVSLRPRSSAVIMMQSRDFNFELNIVETDKDGTFVIRDVAPGAYTILAAEKDAAVPMMALQSLHVVGKSVEGLRLALQPRGWVYGRLRLGGGDNGNKIDPSQLSLVLRAADCDDDLLFSNWDPFTNVTHLAADGSFEWKNVPPGNYHVQFVGEGGANTGWFLKSVLVGDRDMDESGISVNGAVELDLVASANGAVVEGVVADRKGARAANAVITVVPEGRLRTRVDRYRKTVSDQTGRFTLRGIPPGDYTLFAWESLNSESYYNPEFLKKYEGQGSLLRVDEGERKSLQLAAIPVPEDQP